MKLRQAAKSHSLELVAVDPLLGEFALDGTERLEAKDLRLAETMNYQQDDRFRAVTLEQLRDILFSACKLATARSAQRHLF